MIREEYFKMVFERLKTEPDYPFEDDWVTAVFRRKDNLKWFAIVMTVEAKKLGIGAFGQLDIVNLKCAEKDREKLLQYESILPAYHMNKRYWLSIILDDQEELNDLLVELTQKSYELTTHKSKKSKSAVKAEYD